MAEQLKLFPEDPTVVAAKKRKQIRNLITALNEEGLSFRDGWNQIYQDLSKIHKTDVKVTAENLEKKLGKSIKPLDFIEAHGWIDEAEDIATSILKGLRLNK